MKNFYKHGDSAFNNGLNLPVGHLSVDSEKKALRLYDGSTQGGYECIGERAFTPPSSPGPSELIAGTMEHGFFGETTSEELLTYEGLATQIGLSNGTSQFNEESLWLKFALEGKILYVAKKPARHSVRWNQINAVNAVHEGGAQISVGAHTLDVTLLRGAATDPTTDTTGWDNPTSHGSEWNRLMYPIHSGVHTDDRNPTTHTDSTSLPFGSWASYSDTDLVLASGNGRANWCQEAHPGTSNGRVHRGSGGVSYLGRSTSSSATTNFGWRPCLRLPL